MKAGSYLLVLFFTAIAVLFMTWTSSKIDKETKKCRGTERNFLRVVSEALGTSSVILLIFSILLVTMALLSWLSCCTEDKETKEHNKKLFHHGNHGNANKPNVPKIVRAAIS